MPVPAARRIRFPARESHGSRSAVAQNGTAHTSSFLAVRAAGASPGAPRHYDGSVAEPRWCGQAAFKSKSTQADRAGFRTSERDPEMRSVTSSIPLW
jgi:hypothetical protein